MAEQSSNLFRKTHHFKMCSVEEHDRQTNAVLSTVVLIVQDSHTSNGKFAAKMTSLHSVDPSAVSIRGPASRVMMEQDVDVEEDAAIVSRNVTSEASAALMQALAGGARESASCFLRAFESAQFPSLHHLHCHATHSRSN